MKHLSTSVTSTAYKITRTVTGVECDICGKIIPVKCNAWQNEARQYFEITTGHHDWGNDSCDSIETVDVCPECAPKYIADYLESCSLTGYIEVESQEAWAEKTSEVVDKKPEEGEMTTEHHERFW